MSIAITRRRFGQLDNPKVQALSPRIGRLLVHNWWLDGAPRPTSSTHPLVPLARRDGRAAIGWYQLGAEHLDCHAADGLCVQGPSVTQHPHRYAVGFVSQPEQKVLGTHEACAERNRLTEPAFKRVLRPERERKLGVGTRMLLGLGHEHEKQSTGRVLANPARRQNLRCPIAGFMQDTE